MIICEGGGLARCGRLRTIVRGSRGRRRGVVLLAVLVFIALLLPLVTLVLTSINTESVATAEAIKGSKADLAAEKALNDAISLVVQERNFPDYWTSAKQANTAVIVVDQRSGFRRDQIPDQGADGAAGLDDVLGTADDYWVGPRMNGTYYGDIDDESSSRMYGYDFRFITRDVPTYLGQSWSFSGEYDTYGRSPFNGMPIPFFNQYGAVAPDTDTPPDGVDNGYDLGLSDPFNGEDPVLHGPGYYLKSDEPRTNGPGSPVNRNLDSANTIKSYMYNAKVNIYESVFTDLDRGPIPSTLLKSYANVTDEAGRLNLNIFAKKLRVWMPESAETDYDFDGYGSNDFNQNQNPDEDGWKWIDNPLFPDSETTIRWNFNPTTETFTNPGGANGRIDFGSLNADGTMGEADGLSMPELGENAQHYYEGDTDGDGIPQGIEACRSSLEMLMALPGVNGQMAADILEYLNPSQDYFVELGNTIGAGAGYYDPGATWPPDVEPDASPPVRRQDACNITPAMTALEIEFGGGGTIGNIRWNFGDGSAPREYDDDNQDDLPLPPPRTLQTLEQLIDAGVSERQLARLQELVTVHSYDTNVIANYVQDIPQSEDLVNAFQPGDWQFTGLGSTLRSTPQELQDTDDLPDLRFDVDRFVFANTVSEYRQKAEEMYANLRAHLPKPLLDKVTLPAVDRMGRAGAEDHGVDNSDDRYNPALALGTGSFIVPHRDSEARVYNVGASGREDDPDGAGPMEPAHYPALNPEMSLDSCLSAVLYRNGAVFEEDDYTYDPTNGAWKPAASRGLLNFFPFPGMVWFFSGLGPFQTLFADIIEPNNNPYSFVGNNTNPVVRAHGHFVMDPQNLLTPGSFDTTADLLNVPLYQFGRMSVSMMATPPSDYRADLDGDNSVDNAAPEQAPVDYYIAFSDVVDAGWYVENVDPAGPDGRNNTADDPDMERVLYRVEFTVANHENVDYGNTAWEVGDPEPGPGGATPGGGGDRGTAVLDITPMQLRAVGGGASSGKQLITVAAFDNRTSRPFLGPDFYSGLSFPYSWRDVPYPEEDATGGSVTGNRPTGAGAWQAGPGGSLGAQAAQAWAYDGNGDPYITGRVQVIKWDDDNDAPAQPESRSDQAVKVYLQNNVEADIPFRASILPVRLSGDEWEIRSSVGGAEGGANGQFVLYDWAYNSFIAQGVGEHPGNWPPAGDLPPGYDGVWPAQPGQPQQATDPRVIRIRPSDASANGGNLTLILRAYDLRSFSDPAGGWNPSIPIASGYPLLDARMWQGGRVTHPPSPDQFPSAGGYPAGPDFGDAGYAADYATVQGIPGQALVKSQVTVEQPSVFVDENDLRVRVGAAGGTLPYFYRVRILDPGFGEPASRGGNPASSPYLGPDGIGPVTTFPGPTDPPRPSRIDGANNNNWAYDASAVPNLAIWRERIVAGSNSIDETVAFNPSSSGAGAQDPFARGTMPAGEYWVEVQVIDSSGTPLTDYSYSKLTVGTNRSPAGSAGTPPEMNASINLRELENGRHGFVASVSLDGGRGGYSYYWEVRRPVYGGSATAPAIVSDEIALGRVGANTSTSPMTSNEANPSFEFDPQTFTSGGEGVYFVHVYVLDGRSTLPSAGASVLAHDVAMVTLYDDGTLNADPASGTIPSTTSLARTPMAVLAANPPGNTSAAIATNSTGASGSDRPTIGVAAGVGAPALEPDIAGNGDVVVIRGFNFDPLPERNIVRFAGDVEARGFDLQPSIPPASATIGGTAYAQMELSVVVPAGATSGPLTITKEGAGTSASVFFQTGFQVNFDLIGQISSNDAAFVRMDLDFQGDGRVDFSYNSQSNPGGSGTGAAGIARSADLAGLSHDYASDGIGNYNATLIVTDLVSGRKQVSNQLITIKDLRPLSNSVLTIAGGVIDAAAGNNITDNDANFSSSGVQPGDSIVNVNNQSQRSTIQTVSSDTQLTLASAIGGSGTEYVIQRGITGAQVNAMLTNIWPEIDLRSETFTPDAENPGTSFGSATGGAVAAGLRYKWQVDDDSNRSNIGGELRASGCVDAYDPAGRILHDDNANFVAAGVKVGDLVQIKSDDLDGDGIPDNGDGSFANVLQIIGPNDLLLASPDDNLIGLTGGTGLLRTGHADNATPSATQLFDQQNNLGDTGRVYDFRGDACQGQGGVVAGDIAINFTTGATAPVIQPDTPAEGILTTAPLTGGGGIGAPRGAGRPTTGSTGDVLVGQLWQTPPGFFSSGQPFVLPVGAVGDTIELWQGGTTYNTTTGVWVGGTLLQSGTITERNPAGFPGPNRSVRTSFSGWLPDPPSGQRYVVRQAGAGGNMWNNGDEWFVNFPANQLRIGYEYEVFGFSGVQVESRADAAYASFNALIDFDIDLSYPFDLDSSAGRATKIQVDWDGDGTVDRSYAVGNSTRTDNSANSLDIEEIRIQHGFTPGEVGNRDASIPTYLTRAQYRVVIWERNAASARTLPSGAQWYRFPQVVINGDDYDTDLRTLNLSKWGTQSYHRVTLETQYGQTSFQNVGGVSVPVNRNFYATDALLIPPGMENYGDTLSTWVSYTKPFIYTNTLGASSLRHQAVHGAGGALNWMSDANVDARSSDRTNESPLGPNPVNFHEFVVPSGPNLLSPTGALSSGASFPQTAPGVGRASGGGFVYFSGDRGIYNGFGFTADNLPSGQAAFSFDSQALFLGDRVSGTDDENLPLAADLFLDPLVGTTSQILQFTSFVAGSSSNAGSYRYQWELEKIGESVTAGATPSGMGRVGLGGQYGTAQGGGSGNALNPLFSPLADIADENWYQPGGDGSGRYRIYLRVLDAGGNMARSAYREFDIEPVPLRVFMMADPPSASVGSEVQFHVFVDGGVGPYRLEFDLDGDGVFNEGVRDIEGGNQLTFSHVYSAEGQYNATVRVTDSAGQPPVYSGTQATDTQTVNVADTIPLNATLLVNPPSGVAPFLIDVHYAVSGGNPLSGDEYNVTVQLINTDGGGQGAVSRDAASTFGADGQLDDPRRPNGDDDPVRFVVPSAGNYYVMLIATDNDGNVVQRTEDVFATGYVAPAQYGDDVPRVVRDGNNRPQHAFRVWVDPYLNIGQNTDDGWTNEQQNNASGGRLMEADLQVIGDAIMTDPNPSFRSPGIYATKDPANQTKYMASYQLASLGDDLVQDFYDTYTVGRVNLNTASEDVLTALFKRIVKTRAYFEHDDSADVNGDGDSSDLGEQFTWVDTDGDNTIDIASGINDVDFMNGSSGAPDFVDERFRNVRNFADDVHLSEGEARSLARAVIKYRTAFYDAHKPQAPDAGSDFGYAQQLAPAYGSSLRVDHLPVIGPIDGVNPHQYAHDDRNGELLDANSSDLHNAWDHMAANYYNIARGLGGEYNFYSPSDIAVVREPYDLNLTIDVDGDGVDNQDFRFQTTESPGNYAKYLNDTVTNEKWDGNRTYSAEWQPLELYPFANHYSEWSFDARNYFSYEGGGYDVTISLDPNTGVPNDIDVNQTLAAGSPADARNKIGVFESNGETAYGFIPNPPFRSVMDLYKVIDADTWQALFGSDVPLTFQLDSGALELAADFSTRLDVNDPVENAQIYSGPSVFQYAAHWDEASSEFVPVRNFIDDIAALCTCRSYVYRVEASGGVVTSSSQGADEESSRINRDRVRTAIIDTGKLNAGRPTVAGDSQGYKILWQKTSRD